MRITFLTLLLMTGLYSCSSGQEKPIPRLVGGSCEGCEAIFEYGEKSLSATDTLPDFFEAGVPIKVEGTIYQADGKTPAPNVILYVYHTDQRGLYTPKPDATGWARRHGYIRGWMKTDEQGAYAFYTLRPAVYPSRSEAAHIHYTVLEPNGQYYWLESTYFSDDPLLTEEEINPKAPRGGTAGVLDLRQEGDLLVGERDIILGKNIQN